MRGALQKAVREVRIRERSNCEILWRMCRASKRNGDGIFTVFGAPATYEDHPQRALYAALRMQEAS